MLTKIPVSELRLGMSVQKIEGAWASHPFWRSKFRITRQSELASLRSSDIKEVWVDQGEADQASAAATPAIPPEPVTTESPAVFTAVDSPAPAQAHTQDQRELADELQRVPALLKSARAAVAALFDDARLGNAISAERCRPMVEDISASVFRNRTAFISMARLKTYDDYTYMHSVAVCALMVGLARQQGLDDAGCREAGMAGLLHDVGKALLKAEVLNKPGKLTDAEFAHVKAHPVLGEQVLAEGGMEDDKARDACLHHHERWDGKGYPHGLSAQAISVTARMAAVCDVYDAVTSNRVYRAGWDPAEALAQMASWQGHFDRSILANFVKCMGVYPTGSLVRLESDKLAVVVESNQKTPTRPIVKVFYSLRSNMPVASYLLNLAGAGCADGIAGRESPARWNFPYLEMLWAGNPA